MGSFLCIKFMLDGRNHPRPNKTRAPSQHNPQRTQSLEAITWPCKRKASKPVFQIVATQKEMLSHRVNIWISNWQIGCRSFNSQCYINYCAHEFIRCRCDIRAQESRMAENTQHSTILFFSFEVILRAFIMMAPITFSSRFGPSY